MPISDSFRIFWALTRRDVYILSKQIKDFLIDGAVIFCTRITVFCFLFPAMGMSPELIGPLYVGGVLSLFFNITFAQSVRVVFDLKFNQLINYHLGLPINRNWLWIQKIVSFSINGACFTAPIIIGGTLLLKSLIMNMQLSIIAFTVMYLLTLLFFSIFFLMLAFNHPYDWFLSNIWPRRLTPLFCFSSIMFPWKLVYAFWPPLGLLFLCNPFTYIAEGLRSSLLGSDQFISYSICIPVLICSIGLAWLGLLSSIKKRLNPL